MAEEKKNWLGPYIPQGSAFGDFVQQLKLVYKLMLDGRVNPLTKLLPVAAVAYLISPIDLIPDLLVPVIGEVDDIVVMILGFRLFVELAPREVVHEHLQRLTQGTGGNWNVADNPPPPPTPPAKEGKIVDGRFRDEE